MLLWFALAWLMLRPRAGVRANEQHCSSATPRRHVEGQRRAVHRQPILQLTLGDAWLDERDRIGRRNLGRVADRPHG